MKNNQKELFLLWFTIQGIPFKLLLEVMHSKELGNLSSLTNLNNK
jgi:hypothetical protein